MQCKVTHHICYSDCHWIRTHNHLVRKRTLDHLAKLAKWLRWAVSTYLYGEFDGKFLSCQVLVSGWIHNLYSVDPTRLFRARSSLTLQHKTRHDKTRTYCHMLRCLIYFCKFQEINPKHIFFLALFQRFFDQTLLRLISYATIFGQK